MRDWILKKDMNFDGAFTITDIWLFLKSLFFYPGDYLIMHFINTGIGKFFEFSANDYGGFVSGLASFFAWLFIIFLPFGLLEMAREQLNEFCSAFKNGLSGRSKK
jgi:hypothetical protein